MTDPFEPTADGIRLAVRATPRAKKSGVVGVVQGADGRSALGVRLAAPPVEGVANKALLLFLAEWLGVPKSSVRLCSGETSRLKIVEISGDAEMLAARLRSLLQA